MARKKVDIGSNKLTNDDAYTMRMRGGKSGGGKGPLLQNNISGTLTASNDQVLFQSMSVDDDSADCTKDTKLYVVRRLTPREFERLQGMPDDYTLVPYNGKPIERCPDYLRYRAIGNSMAVNVMRWIGECVATVDALLLATEERASE